MADLVSDISSGTEENQEFDHILPGPLILTGDSPVTIYIKAKPSSSPTYSAYGLARHGEFYTGGITWQNDMEYGKFITFHFLHGVKSVGCGGLPYSPAIGETQQLCILPVAPATYPFTVYFSAERLANLCCTSSIGCSSKVRQRLLAGQMSPNVFGPNESWTDGQYVGDHGIYFADIDGSGRAAAIVVNNNQIVIRRSTGNGFGPNEVWSDHQYLGDHGIYFADIDGSGRAAAIVVNNNQIVIRRSTGNGFGPNEVWSDHQYLGSHGNYFADVDGSGRAAAIVVNDGQIVIRRSTGNGFGPNEVWSDHQYLGDHGIYFADIDGSGRAAAIVVNNNQIVVRRSTGHGFGPNEVWSDHQYLGSHGNYFADVDGSGRAAAIVVNDNQVVIRRSTGNGFGGNEVWSNHVYLGDHGNYFARISAEHLGAIVVNSSGITVRRAVYWGPGIIKIIARLGFLFHEQSGEQSVMQWTASNVAAANEQIRSNPQLPPYPDDSIEPSTYDPISLILDVYAWATGEEVMQIVANSALADYVTSLAEAITDVILSIVLDPQVSPDQMGVGDFDPAGGDWAG